MSQLAFALLVPGPPGHLGTSTRNRVADALAVLAALAYGALMVAVGDATKPGAAIPWQIDVAIGVLCTAFLVLRRRWSLRLCLVLLPFGAISVMATGAILVALFTVAIRYRPRVLVPLGIAHIATGVIYYVIQNDPPMALWVDIVMRAVTGFAAIGWGLFLRAHRGLTESLRIHAARLESEQNLRVDRARLTERSRIAREMHDVLAHRMSMVSLQAGALEVRSDATPEETTTAAKAIRLSAHEALEELRTVIGVLRQEEPSRPEPPQPGLDDVPDLLRNARASGMTIEWVFQPPPADSPPALGRTAYRLVQEALTNASRHAPGAAVEVVLDREDATGDMRISVSNPLPHSPAAGGEPDATGGSAADRAATTDSVPGSGSGLIGVGERVALAGGHVEYGPRDGRFHLEARLPWHGR